MPKPDASAPDGGSTATRFDLLPLPGAPFGGLIRLNAADDAGDKRSRKIDTLLDGTGYADLFAGKWAAILRNKTHNNLAQVRRETHAFHDWIRGHIRRNTPFDQFAVCQIRVPP